MSSENSPLKDSTAPTASVTPSAVHDEDLADIMSEIRGLQESMATTEAEASAPELAPEPAPIPASLPGVESEKSGNDLELESAKPLTGESAAETAGMESFHAGSDDVPMEETLAAMKDEGSSSGQGLLDQVVTPFPDQSERQSERQGEMSTSALFKSADGATQGELSMVLSGNMTLNLKYDFSGKQVSLSFSDDVLTVQLSDGAEFKIPLGAKKQMRAA